MNTPDTKKFVSFEGIDFSGKTTQIDLLKAWLEQENERVVIFREPGGTAISEQIRNILLDKNHPEMTDICEIFLYSAARNQLIKEKIIPELAAGNFVIADRYVDSTTAYQGFGREIPKELINHINIAATTGLMPATTFILDLAPEQIVSRRESRKREDDRLETAGLDFFKRVYKGYHKIAELEPERVKLIDAARPVESIFNEIREFIAAKLNLK
jgi:dTMP kinase